MTQFSNEQIDQIRTWCKEIHTIGDLQTRINDTFKAHLTFLDTRFLMDDFNLQLASDKKENDPKVSSEPSSISTPLEGELIGQGSVQVSVDPVTRPGMMVNGSVIFSDGQKATWGLDQLGRLSIKPSKMGYRPSQKDIAQFQESLQEKLAEVSQRSTLGL